LSKELSGRIDAFLERCYRYGFASESEHVDVLLDRVCVDLFHKYVALNIVRMTFGFLYSVSAMTCVIGLTRLYYPNVTVIYIRNHLLIIVCSKMCNH